MNPIDINRLQILNDLIAQTIDIMNQRGLSAVQNPYAQMPFAQQQGFSHSPFIPQVAAQLGAISPLAAMGWPAQYPAFGAGLAHSPYTPFASYPATASGIPGIHTPFQMGVPFAGLSHSPFSPFATQLPMAQSIQAPFGLANPYGGLSHSPFTVGAPIPMGWNVPTGASLGGLNHTPWVDPRFVPTIPSPVAAGLSHSPYLDPRWAAVAARATVPMTSPFIQ